MPAGKAKKQATATDEQAAAEGTEGGGPAETATGADGQPEKDDS